MEGKKTLIKKLPNSRAELERLVDDYHQLEERTNELEKELKTTITKKNRLIRKRDKKIKYLEWDNMIHRNGHSRLYASLHSLREELKEKGIKVDWVK